MFDFAWSELALIAVVALVVIGPKDLPRVLRVVGQWVRQARGIAREFQGSLDQMIRESELDDVKRSLDRATSFNLENEIRNTVDPHGELQRSLSEPVLTDPMADQAVDMLATEPKAIEAGEASKQIEPPVFPAPEPVIREPIDVKPSALEPEKHRPLND
jgi:sec-independent protein translocase protein TatB